jgi:ATP-dependent DNA helicase RecG
MERDAVRQIDDIDRWSSLREGQFFERKSAFQGAPNHRTARPSRDVARDIAETLAAMANADGGELVVGIEDGGDITGVPHATPSIALFLRVPEDRNYIQPPLNAEVRQIRTADGKTLLYFAVDWSPTVHHLADGRYMLRVNDANMPFDADLISALKHTKAQGLIERSFPAGATMDDLDNDLIIATIHRLDSDLSVGAFLQQYRLVDNRNGHLVPCLAGLLLFGRDPLRWHPRPGIDFVRWEGTERRHGAELNVTKRIRIEEPLALLIEAAHDAIRPFIRERQKLQDLFFTEELEYPSFVWQETIVNAVAHRDYGIQGAPTEIWMFDDHMEIRSPGLPPHPATVEGLNRRQHLHVSRNPLMVRLLVDLGFMRELGEGIPRMFAEMEREGFYPPDFDSVGGVSLRVTQRNQPVYDRETFAWLQRFKDSELSGDQKRLLAFAHGQGDRFTSRDYQRLAGLDVYHASVSIRALIRKGVVRPTEKGGRVYEVVAPGLRRRPVPSELVRLLPTIEAQGWVRNQDVQDVLGVSRATATRLLERLVAEGWLERSGARRGSRYFLLQGLMTQLYMAHDDRERESFHSQREA